MLPLLRVPFLHGMVLARQRAGKAKGSIGWVTPRHTQLHNTLFQTVLMHLYLSMDAR